MPQTTNSPTQTVEQLIAALSEGQLQTVMSFYDANATFLAQPTTPAIGTDAIRQAMEGFMQSLKPKLNIEKSREFILGDVACVVAQWSGSGTSPDGSVVEMAGRSANVLARKADGHWVVLLDNPWGTDLFGQLDMS